MPSTKMPRIGIRQIRTACHRCTGRTIPTPQGMRRQYVKICSLYGAGFFYIPGTDTCLKIGGYLRSDHIYGMANAGGYYMSSPSAQETRTSGDSYSFRARVNMTLDWRTQSD